MSQPGDRRAPSDARQAGADDMTGNEYQRSAGRTNINAPGFAIGDAEAMFAWHAVGLCGEAGEVAELVKKGVFHRKGIDVARLEKELGDVLWYVAALASCAGLN